MTPYQVNVAAEAFAAMVLSQAGYDVAFNTGRNSRVGIFKRKRLNASWRCKSKGVRIAVGGFFRAILRTQTTMAH